MGEGLGGGSAGAPTSHASTAQMPAWYRARAAAAPRPRSAPASSASAHMATTCAARRRLGGSARGAGPPRGAARRRRTCSSPGAHAASAAQALLPSRLPATSSAHDVATLAARPYTSQRAYLRPRAEGVFFG